MTTNDRFFYDECITCGALITTGDDNKEKHHNWHLEMEKVISVMEYIVKLFINHV